jgi:hypothetical protein
LSQKETRRYYNGKLIDAVKSTKFVLRNAYAYQDLSILPKQPVSFFRIE